MPVLRCGTPEPTPAELATLAQVAHPLHARQPAGPVTYVPLRIHIVRRTDGTGGVDVAAVYQSIAETNSQFVQSNTQLYVCGAPNYIDNTAWFNFNSQNEGALSSGANYDSNQINLYFVNSINRNGNSSVGGYAYVNPGPGERKVFLAGVGPLAHELGHTFGLLHTFNNNNSFNFANRELVARTNCNSAGDFICDTPADPYGLPGSTSDNCVYTGTATDAQGSLFVPDMRNVMSYWFCGSEYTPFQYAYMQANRMTSQANLTCSRPAAAAPTGLAVTSGSCLGQTRLSWRNPVSGPAAVGYFIERASGSSDFAAIAAVEVGATSYVDQSIPGFTAVQYRVKPINAAASFSNVVGLTTARMYCRAAHNTPNTCTDKPEEAFGLGSVTLRQGQTIILAHSTTSCGPSASSFPTEYARLLPSTSYSLDVKLFTFNNGYYYPQHVSVWLDLNQNGSFAEPNELLFQSTQPAVSYAATFTLPPGVANGCGALRVRTQYVSLGSITSSCAPLVYGETQDYPVLFGTALSTVSPARQPALTVLPNPAAGQATVHLSATRTKPETLYVLDRLGREIRRYTIAASATQTTVDLTGFPAGLYLLRLSSSTARLVVE
ncbi:GEVED domain-containing protein [Hymenobacter elongatus]|nr:GEVED domain-containing protein [Hymenobacter elongatus]